MIDLNDTSACPPGDACAVCATTVDVALAVASCRQGVFCLAVCGECENGELPPIPSALQAFELVAAHCEHLGIDLDQMAELLEQEK